MTGTVKLQRCILRRSNTPKYNRCERFISNLILLVQLVLAGVPAVVVVAVVVARKDPT